MAESSKGKEKISDNDVRKAQIQEYEDKIDLYKGLINSLLEVGLTGYSDAVQKTTRLDPFIFQEFPFHLNVQLGDGEVYNGKFGQHGTQSPRMDVSLIQAPISGELVSKLLRLKMENVVKVYARLDLDNSRWLIVEPVVPLMIFVKQERIKHEQSTHGKGGKSWQVASMQFVPNVIGDIMQGWLWLNERNLSPYTRIADSLYVSDQRRGLIIPSMIRKSSTTDFSHLIALVKAIVEGPPGRAPHALQRFLNFPYTGDGLEDRFLFLYPVFWSPDRRVAYIFKLYSLMIELPEFGHLMRRSMFKPPLAQGGPAWKAEILKSKKSDILLAVFNTRIQSQNPTIPVNAVGHPTTVADNYDWVSFNRNFLVHHNHHVPHFPKYKLLTQVQIEKIINDTFPSFYSDTFEAMCDIQISEREKPRSNVTSKLLEAMPAVRSELLKVFFC